VIGRRGYRPPHPIWAHLGEILIALALLGFLALFWTSRQQDRAAVTETAADAQVARGLERDADRATAADTLDLHERRHRAQELTDAIAQEAAADPDGRRPLPPAVADRMRRHDDFLCRLRPQVCAPAGAAAPGGDAGRGD
jgi:hypothetical protein